MCRTNRSAPARSQSQVQTPLYVNGRVLLADTGQPAPEPVSVQLDCGVSVLQVIQTDLKGYFQFTFGAGPQSNANLGAADDTPIGMAGGTNFPGSRGRRWYWRRLDGLRNPCGSRWLSTGQPSSHRSSRTDDHGCRHDTPVRIAGVQGSAISVTSMLVPNNARKEFEKGDKDAQDNKLKPGDRAPRKSRRGI